MGMLEVAREFDGLPPSVIVFSDLKVTFGNNRLDRSFPSGRRRHFRGR